TAWLAVFNGECGVEQQNALVCPAAEIASAWHAAVEISMQFFEDVAQAWRQRHSLGHRKSQSMRLARTVIWVLSEDYHVHSLQRRELQRTEDASRVDDSPRSPKRFNFAHHLFACGASKKGLNDMEPASR